MLYLAVHVQPFHLDLLVCCFKNPLYLVTEVFSQFPSIAVSFSYSTAALAFFFFFLYALFKLISCRTGDVFLGPVLIATKFVVTNKPRLFHVVMYTTLYIHSCYLNVFSFSISCQMCVAFFMAGTPQKFSRVSCGKPMLKFDALKRSK